MTSVPATTTAARRKRPLLVLLALLLTGGAVGSYFAWWPSKAAIPVIRTEGRDPEVIAAIDKARAEVERRPRSGAAWGRLGMVLFANDMYEECIDILIEAERLDPREARWPYFHGLALILQKPEEGIVHLQRAAALSPDVIAIHLRLAEEFAKLDRINEAEPLFNDILATEPNNPRALLARGQILSRRDHWEEALVPLQQAAEDPTAQRSARVALAEAYAHLGKVDASEVERAHAADSAPDRAWPDPFLIELQPFRTGLQPRIDQARSLLNTGQSEAALALIEQVLHDHPDSDEAHLTLASTLIRLGSFREAQQEVRAAIRLNPRLVDAHILLGGILVQQHDYPAAEQSYLRAVDLKPTYGLAHYNIGDCRLKQGDKAGAIEAFREAVRHRPDLAVAQLELGALLLQNNRVEEALTHLNAAVRLDGKNDRARSILEQARAKTKS